MTPAGRIAIVGASLAGLRTAEALRRGDFEGEICLIGEEPHLPYDRPPLSKEVLRGEWGPERIALRRKGYESLALDMRLGCRAVSLDASAREVHSSTGDRVSFDRLVIATGAKPRHLPGQPDLDGVFVLRTIDHALGIRRALGRASRLVVIGAGFIGAEVAASARALGVEVAMVEALDAPLARSLGPRVGRILQRLHERRGVEVHCGRSVREFRGDRQVRSLLLDDGTVLDCDLVVIGIGVSPDIGWLEGSGISLGDGVLCDASCRTNVPGIFAVGDVANWYNPLFDERMRIEHWTNAVEQARYVARAIVAPEAGVGPFTTVPMFWSDQYGMKIQGVGRPRATDDLILTGGTEAEDKPLALYGRAGRLVGAVAFDHPPKIMALRALIGERGGLEGGVEIAES